MTSPTEAPAATGSEWLARIALAAGPIVGALLVLITHPSCAGRGSLGPDAACTLGLLAWMAIWWMSEAVPLP